VLSVAIASLLCYPVLFLYDPSSAGSFSVPHHVWASARLVDEDPSLKVDVELRQVWVHGSYMKAIERGVLREALAIQDALIGAAFSEQIEQDSGGQLDNGVVSEVASQAYHDACKLQSQLNVTWGFHSPLMYWNCSHEALESDTDLLETINRQVHRQSFLKFTLRPISVFAGKVFSGSRIKAADALVITLISRPESPAGIEWDRRSTELARAAADRGWKFYPKTGEPPKSQLFQFRIQPMSLNDDFMLAVAYAAMATYVVKSLRRLRAVRSRFGLGITILTQVPPHAIDLFSAGVDRVRLSSRSWQALQSVACCASIWQGSLGKLTRSWCSS
jgi:hypothetical protein